MKKLGLVVFIALGSTANAQVSSYLSGQIENYKANSIKIILSENTITRQSETFHVPVVNGRFKHQIKISKPTYLYTTDGTNYVNGLLEPGDNTTLFFDANDLKGSLRFEGKGSEKFSFLNSFLQFRLYNKLKEQVPVAKGAKYPFDHMFHFIDSTGNSFLRKLNMLKASMNDLSFKLLEADVRSGMMSHRYRSVGLIYHESVNETLAKRAAELTPYSKQLLQNILKFDERFSYSTTYASEVYNMLFMDYDGLVLSGKMNKDLSRKYDYLNSRLPAKLKIPVLTLFLEHDINKLNQSEDIERILDKTYIKTGDIIYENYVRTKYLNATSFKKGMPAPGFELENQRGEKVSLASFKGKVIYLDFWFAACGPCHALFETIKPVKQYFSNNDNVVFLHVSIDPKEVWQKSLVKYDIKGYHAFTENKERDHPIIAAYKVAGYPTTCLIDGDGKIFLANPASDVEELIKQIEAAISLKPAKL